MSDPLSRIAENLVGRIDGPMHFRLILQPAMAAVFAIKSGLKDARTAAPVFFWALFTDSNHRRDMLRDGWKSIRNVFIAALAIDFVYQLIEFRMFYVGEAVLVGLILAITPYLIIRGPANRLGSLFIRRSETTAPIPHSKTRVAAAGRDKER